VMSLDVVVRRRNRHPKRLSSIPQAHDVGPLSTESVGIRDVPFC
jgi:hypothetical protein